MPPSLELLTRPFYTLATGLPSTGFPVSRILTKVAKSLPPVLSAVKQPETYSEYRLDILPTKNSTDGGRA